MSTLSLHEEIAAVNKQRIGPTNYRPAQISHTFPVSYARLPGGLRTSDALGRRVLYGRERS